MPKRESFTCSTRSDEHKYVEIFKNKEGFKIELHANILMTSSPKHSKFTLHKVDIPKKEIQTDDEHLMFAQGAEYFIEIFDNVSEILFHDYDTSDTICFNIDVEDKDRLRKLFKKLR